MPDLLVATDTVYILCHSENVDPLLSALTMEGFSVNVNRQVLDSEHYDYSLIIRALLTSKWVEVQVGATRSYAIWAVTA